MNNTNTMIKDSFANILEETKNISSGWPELFFVKIEAKELVHWPFRKETGACKSKAACKVQAEKTLSGVYYHAEERFHQAKDEVRSPDQLLRPPDRASEPAGWPSGAIADF